MRRDEALPLPPPLAPISRFRNRVEWELEERRRFRQRTGMRRRDAEEPVEFGIGYFTDA